ncbi:MAG: hydantoinase B/oxoprolinase family protein [Alphaproteobacteria bacterium]|nr:hydantoinase B/oxoprolinase family protein [Alphaproteobacteria bacterium]
MSGADVDLITAEIVQNALDSFIGEMRVAIIRTAFGPNIWETHDFSCGLLAPDGDLVALSEDNPVHIVPTMYCVPAVRKRYGGNVMPGDIFLLNDPYELGTHVNDVAHIAPFFLRDRLVFWVVVRVHYPDVGGMAAGSITPDAREVYQEGLRIPAVKVYDGGEPNRSFLKLFFDNVRIPEERRGDFMAVMGALRTADVRLREVLGRFGLETVERVCEMARRRAESRMRRAIHGIPEGEFAYELNLDSNGVEPGWVALRATIIVDHKSDTPMTVDFSDSAPAVPGPMNGAPATAACAAITAIKAFLDPHSRINGGTFRPVRVVTEPGTIFEAPHPSAMCGSLDLGYRVIALVMGALGAIRPESAVGDYVSPSHQYMPVWDSVRGCEYVFYDVPIGGTGAVSDRDGGDAVAGFERGDFPRVSSAEIWEHQVPLMAEEIALRPDSGGAGKFRGGLAMRRSWRVLTDRGTVSDLSEPGLISNYGVLGGYGGVASTCRIERNGQLLWPGGETGTGKATRYPIRAGDIVQFDKWGGGGYGDPLERHPLQVLEDLEEGFITVASAEKDYGVVILDGVVDEAATADKRCALKDKRVVLAVVARDADSVEDGERHWVIAPDAAARLQVADGQVLECVSPLRPPLRGRTRVFHNAEPDRIGVGPMARKVLAVGHGDRVWLRPVPAFFDPDGR